MFLTLTNSNSTQPGEAISINMSMVVTMNRATVMQEDGTELAKTYLFIPPHGTWEVKETLGEIMTMLDKDSNSIETTLG
jgi:hypothetical protein